MAKVTYKEYRQAIANRFAECLIKEPKKWHKSWFTTRPPFNGKTNRPLNGINRLWLSYVMAANGWEDPRFMTYKQAQSLGGQVRKGEKSARVEFWSPYNKETKKCITWAEAEDLHKDEEKKNNLTMVAAFYSEFNGTQIDGLPEYHDDRETNTKPNETMLKIANEIGVEVKRGEPAFSPDDNAVFMPSANRFDSDEEYAASLAHELSHATGPIVGRVQSTSRDDTYAREELVAEISACFVCSEMGIESNMDSHEAYVQSWAKRIKQDPDVLVSAVKDAELSSDYLLVKGGLISRSDFYARHRKTPEAVEVPPEKRGQKPEFSEGEGGKPEVSEGKVWVKPHTRKGRPVKGHWRKK